VKTEILALVLLGSLISAATLFFYSFYLSVLGNIKWAKLLAFGLLNLVFSCAVILYCGNSQISLSQAGNLKISAFVFAGLSALFYWSYQLAKNNNE